MNSENDGPNSAHECRIAVGRLNQNHAVPVSLRHVAVATSWSFRPPISPSPHPPILGPGRFLLNNVYRRLTLRGWRALSPERTR